MTAFIIVDLTVKNKDLLSEYSALAAQTLIPFDGEFIAKGAIESLHGESAYTTKVVIQFPSRENAQNWYQSKDYQQIIPIRDEAMNSQFHLVG